MIRSISRLIAILLAMTSLSWAPFASAQDHATELDPGPVVSGFNALDGLGLNSFTPGVGGDKVAVSATFTADPTGKGILQVTAKMAPGWHIYSLTQKPGGPQRSEIVLEPSDVFDVTGRWTADQKPELEKSEFFPVPMEKHHDQVTWSVPIQVASTTHIRDLQISGQVDGQVCEDMGSCIPLSSLGTSFIAKLEGASTQTDQAIIATPRQLTSEPFRVPGSHVQLTGSVSRKAAGDAGEVYSLTITAVADPGWHVYPVITDGYDNPFATPTLLGLQLPPGWTVSKPKASVEPHLETSDIGNVIYHEGQVAWSMDIAPPKDISAGTYELTGSIGLQTCEQVCDMPAGADFTAILTVGNGSAARLTPVAYQASSYKRAQELANTTVFAGTVNSPLVESDPESIEEKATSGTQTSASAPILSLASLRFLGIAYLAGLILNVMPCVLPVIGLKVMAFVQQAGESRFRILALNLWFCLGLMLVFMLLATGAAFANMGWGEQMQSVEFNIVLLCIVFVFALSFLGIWEIPIPGFVGGSTASKVAEREGPTGAFIKGVLTTILATPCAGPMLGPAVGWAVRQPPAVTYVMFFFIGMGMATPYLLIGVFPQAIKLLPKPGAWMDTFKQLMGFVLLGTVVFIISFLTVDYTVPVLIMLVGLGLACWHIGRTPLTAALSQRLRAWGVGTVLTVIFAWFSFGWMMSGVELDWQSFERMALEQHRADGQTVLVDFTADW